jgi:hypothetical protein
MNRSTRSARSATLAISAASMFISACATQATLGPLRSAQVQCDVQHIVQACAAIPILQQAANDEANHNGMLTVGLILLAPIAILAAAGAAHDDDDVVVVHRRYRGW